MAQNANRAWSDSARDSEYLSRSSRISSDISLPADPLPEFESAFRERDRRSGQFERRSQGYDTFSSSSSRPYAAAISRDYASRDSARVSSNPYSTLSRQRNSLGYRETASTSTSPRIHAEAFQPMGSHSVEGQRRRIADAPSTRTAGRADFEREASRNYRRSADFMREETPQNTQARRAAAGDRQGNHASSRAKKAEAEAEAPYTKAQKREERRRRRRHEQADKKFNRQFAGETSSPSEGGPRAAVTKAEMGSKQRKAMRAQQAGSFDLPFLGGALGAAFATVGAAVMAIVQGFMRWRTLKKTVCAVAIIVLVCACVYTPAQQYYQTLRLNDRLEAEYKAIEERNDALGLDLATLGTREGVEARAHEQFGLVQEGEESANVLGLDYTYDHSTTMMAAIPSGSVEMPDPAWYTPLLDAIFGIEKDESQ